MLEEIFEYPFLIKIFNSLLTDKEKINIISVNKYINQNKYKLKFYEQKHCRPSDWKRWYFDCLTKIEISVLFKLPQLITHLKINEIIEIVEKEDIPESVTHYHVKNKGKFKISEIFIPRFCTHLYIKNFSCQHHLTKNVTHLEINHYDDSEFHVPKSVTHLKINCKILCIKSKTLTHLEFRTRAEQINKNLILNTPNLKCVTFITFYNFKIFDNFPPSVKYLKFQYTLSDIFNSVDLSNIERIKLGNYFGLQFPPHINKISHYKNNNDLSIAGFKYN